MRESARVVCATVAAGLWLAGCSASNGESSLLDRLDLPTFGSDIFMGGDNAPLEVPPDLDAIDASDSLQIPGGKGRISAAMGAALNSRVLPERLDLRLRREGDLVWLAADVSPAALWPAIQEFLRRGGFDVVASNPTHGTIETAWRERRLQVAGEQGYARLRTRLRIRLEREPNAVTSLFLSSRDAGYVDGEWRILSPDVGFERRMLLRFRDYLAAGREVASPRMASLDDIKIALDINNVAGAAVLTVGQRYSKAWRRVGAAIGRAGIEIFGDDRSRGIYLVGYADVSADGRYSIDGVAGRAQPLQLHLLAKGDRTLVTVHPNVVGDDVPYALAHQILKRVLMAYEVRDVVSR